jgi:hypothetical protein
MFPLLGSRWEWKSLRDAARDQILKMQSLGMTVRDIAMALGESLFYVKSVLADAATMTKPAPTGYDDDDDDDDLW